MADFPALRPALLACAGLLALAGCASVGDDVTMAKVAAPVEAEEVATIVMPAAKPGTEGTAEALPAPVAAAETADAAAVPVSALAGARPVTGAAAATAALAAGPAEVTDFQVSVMEPGFDAGAPEGLEELVASRKIVPVARPAAASLALRSAEPSLAVPRAEQPIRKSGTPIDELVDKYAAIYGIPEALLHRVVRRESTYNPRAYNNGHYGLMQIKYATARSMGYQGPAEGLFDAETNLKYAGKYLRGAWLVADDKNDGAVRLYAAGYYYHAKRKGLLEETGLR